MTYRHTQHGPLYLIPVGLAGIIIVLGRVLPDTPPNVNPFDLGGLLLATVGFCFKTLTVRDAGDHLLLEFGRLPLFWHRVPYSSITAVRRSRSRWVDGWGIHCVVGRGWTYNLWGFDCAEIQRGNRRERIGTDDPDGLLRFLESRLSAPAGSAR